MCFIQEKENSNTNLIHNVLLWEIVEKKSCLSKFFFLFVKENCTFSFKKKRNYREFHVISIVIFLNLQSKNLHSHTIICYSQCIDTNIFKTICSVNTETSIFHNNIIHRKIKVMTHKFCLQGPSIHDVTHFLRFLTPPSPLSPILQKRLMEQHHQSANPPPPKWVTSFMNSPIVRSKQHNCEQLSALFDQQLKLV